LKHAGQTLEIEHDTDRDKFMKEALEPASSYVRTIAGVATPDIAP
jgi:hypothetical protein